MLWIDKRTGNIYELRMTSVGHDTYDHEKYKSYEIGGVMVVGEGQLDTLEYLEFLGWL